MNKKKATSTFFKTSTISGEKAKIYIIFHYNVVIIRKYILLNEDQGNFEEFNYLNKKIFKNKILWAQEITLVVDSFVDVVKLVTLMFESEENKNIKINKLKWN